MQHENDRSGHSDLEERTTKARIRDAAITEFSEKGFNGASIRGIAERASVSPGLVQHHFGTKQELREACDQHVMKMFQRALVEGYRRGGVGDPGFIDEMYRSMLPLVSYLMMSIGSGAEGTTDWFGELVALNRASLERGDLGHPISEAQDVAAIAAVMTAMQLGTVLLYDRIFAELGANWDDPGAVARVGRARMYIASGQLLGPELAARIREGLDRYEQVYASAVPAGPSNDEEMQP